MNSNVKEKTRSSKSEVTSCVTWPEISCHLNAGWGDLRILWRGRGNKKEEGQADISLNKE